MSTELSGLFQLPRMSHIVPVMDLSEESRAQIEFDTGDCGFACNRATARRSSAPRRRMCWGNSASRDRSKAVILFGREKNFDPTKY